MPRYLDDGGWVPIHQAAAAHLPRDRAYSEVEAMVSLSIDLNAGRQLSDRQYARIWRWSRGKVRRFLERVLGEGPTVGEEAVSGPEEFMYVAGLRRDAGHFNNVQARATNEATRGPEEVKWNGQLQLGTDHRQDHARATASDPDPDTKKKSARRSKAPWHGKTRDLDALLACTPFLTKVLAEISPVLATWTVAEAQAWSRQMIAKGQAKRARGGQAPLVDFAQYLRICAKHAKPHERPKLASASAPSDLERAAESMGVEW